MSKKLNLPIALGILLIGLFSANLSQAQFTNAYWDVNGTTAGQGGTGSFSSNSVFWTTNSANATANTGGPNGGGLFFITNGPGGTSTLNNSGGYNINFGGTAGTVNQSGGFQFASVNFLTSGYIWSIDGSGTNGRTITTTNGVNLGANAVTLANGARGVNSFTFSGPTTATAVGITGTNGSTLTLRNLVADSTTNSFAVYLSGGTISSNIGINVDIGTGSKIALGSQSSGGATINSAITLNTNASGVALNITNSSSGTVALNGVISGNNGLVLDQAGSGKIVLAGANTYAGGTTLNMVGSTGEIWASNNSAFGTGTITTGTGTNYVRSGSVTISNAVAIGAGTTLRLGGISSSTDTSTWAGVISGAGGINYTLSDGGLYLTGTNSSFGGGVNVGSSGKLYVSKLGMAGANSSIGTNGTVTINSASGTSGAADINWTGAADETSDKNFALTTASSSGSAGMRIYARGATNASLTLNGNINSTGISNKVITLAGYATNTLRMNGLINETAGYTNSVVVGASSSGTVILNGTNTFGGPVTITQATAGQYTWLQTTNIGNSGAASALGKNRTINIGSTNDTAFTTLKYTGTGETSDKVINLAGTLGGATLDQSGTGNLNFSSAITGTGTGAKTVRLAGSSAGTGELSGSLTNAGGNVISVSKSGTGTWALSASNSYSGGTTISGGTLQARNANALGTGTVTVGSDGTLNVATVAVANTVKNSGTVSIGAGGTLSASTMAPDAGGQGSLVLGGTSGSLARFNSTVGTGTSSASTVLALGNLTMNGNSVFSLQEIYTTISAATVTFAGTGNSISLNGKSNLWGANTYTLLSGTGMSGADSNLLLDLGAGNTVALGSSLLVGLKTYSFSQAGTALTMGITTSAVANQVWDSSVSSGAWSTTAQNWLTDGTGTPVAFNSGDNAALNSTATIAVDAGGISAGAVTLTNSAATVNLTGGNLTAGTLDKSGGNLVLGNGANSFSGIVNSAGTLTSTGTLTTTAEGIQATGGQVNLNGSNNISGALRVNGGNVSVDAAATLSSQAINVSNGALALGTSASNGALTISGGSITGAGTLTNTSVAASGGTIEASLAGTGGLTKTGVGDFNLNNSANTFTGGVTVSAGKLSAGVANNLSGQAVTVNGGTLDIGAFNNTATSVDLQSGSITGTTGALTAPVTANVASGVTASVGAGLTGTSSLTKNGTGTLTLSGSNSYTGNTAVNFGTLETVGSDRMADSSAVTLAAGTTLKLGGNETVASVASTSTSATLNLQGNTLNVGGTGLSFTNTALTTGTGGSLVKNGAGLLYLNNGNNTYTGGFTLNGGEVQYTTSGSAGSGGVTNSVFGTGTVTLNSGIFGSSSTAGSSGRTLNNNVTLNGNVQYGMTSWGTTNAKMNSGNDLLFVSTNAGGTTTLAGNSTISTYGYVNWEQSMSGNYRLTKDGVGASSLSNNYLSLRGSNNISGVTVNSGLLGYKNRNALGTGTLILADGVTIGQDGSVNNTPTTDIIADRTVANNISMLGNATFGLGGTAAYFSGSLDLNNGNRTLTLQNSLNLYGSITNGGLVVDRLGTDLTSSKTLYLYGASSYENGTTMNGVVGRTNNSLLGLGNDNALGTGSLTFAGSSGAAGVTNVLRGITQSTGDQNRTIGNAIAINSGVNVTVDTITNLVTYSSGSAVTNDVSVNMVLNGNISGAGSLTKTNANTLTLGGANTYSGGTTVSGGTLIGTTASLQGTITNNAAVTFNQSSSGSYNGVISGTGLLSKTGAGTVTLTRTNTYSGATTLTQGSLLVDTTGSIASSSATVNGGLLNVNGTAGAVTVNNGGSLGGSGTVGALSLNNGGSLNPGNSPGTLTAAQAIVMGGSTYNWQISNSGAGTTAGTDWDLFSVGGLLNMSNVTDANKWNLVVTADGAFTGWTDSNSPYEYVFAQAAGISLSSGFSTAVGTDVTSLFNITSSGITSLPNSSYNANGDFKVLVGRGSNDVITLNLQAIPEPSTGSMLTLGIAGLVATRLLRRKSS